jgi:hypothetical protein
MISRLFGYVFGLSFLGFFLLALWGKKGYD